VTYVAGPLSHIVAPTGPLCSGCHIDSLLMGLGVLSGQNVNLSIVVHLELPVERIMAKFLENIVMESLDEICPGGSLGHQLLMVRHKLRLTALDTGHLCFQLLNLVNLSLPTVLSGHLILPSPPDIPAQSELFLRELVFTQQVIELIHWQVDDLTAGYGKA